MRCAGWIGLLWLAQGLVPAAGQGTAVPVHPDALSRAEHVRLAGVAFRPLAFAGSPSQEVSAMVQDKAGFMWFATADGLFRYDGYEMRAARPIPFDTTSLSDPWPNGLALDGAGGLWVTTESGGLNRYDAATERFRRYPSAAPRRTNAVVRDRRGVLWIAAKYEGLFRFDPATGRTDRFAARPRDPGALPSDRIEALLLERAGGLWVGSADGTLSRLDPTTNRFRTFRSAPADPASLPGGAIHALHEDRQGRLWVGTANGLARYDRASGQFVRYPRVDGAGASASDIWALLEDPEGVLWVGSAAGLDRLDPATGTFTPYRHDPADPTSLKRGGVSSLYLDRTGVFWVGTASGVSFFERKRPPFEHIAHDPNDANTLDAPDVWAILEDRAGALWVGTGAGLNRVDRATRRITHYSPDPSDPSRLASRVVMGIYEARDGTFWVSSRPGGLHRFDRATGRVAERFAEIPGDPASLRSENPWWMLEDRKGRTWITSGGPGCLNEMHRATGTFTRYCHDPNNLNTPAYDFARYLIEGRDGALWLGTWGGGLDRFDPATGHFTHYRHDPANRNTPSSDFILFLRADADGMLWLGTFGGGFSRFDPATGRFTHYTTLNTDLPSDVVYGIEPDNAGRLWLSTNAGLVRFDPATGAMRTFGVEDGIQALEFNSGASFRSASGELFFGGANGLTAFYPDRIVDDPIAPTVVLTRLQVGGATVHAYGPGSPLDAALPYAREIRLRPHQRDLTITFAALHFADPGQNQYRYRLEGYDDAWRTPGPERTATYTNLDPGRYSFRVKAANSDGVWNEAGTAITLVVWPPWWKTWWAYLGYVVLLAGGLTLVYRNRQRPPPPAAPHGDGAAGGRAAPRTRPARGAASSPTSATSSGRRSRSHSGRSTTFRRGSTGRSLRRWPSRWALPGATPAACSTSSTRSSTWPASKPAACASAPARSTSGPSSGGSRGGSRRSPRASPSPSTSTSPEAPLVVYGDPEQLEKVFANLLSNALKFTPGGGAVRVSVEADGGHARVTIRDSGPGIPAADLPHVFDRFYRVNESAVRMQPGTGIGLALAKELVDLHGGTLSAASEEGFGSCFTASLRLGRAHLAPDQISDEGAGAGSAVQVPPPLLVISEPGGDGEADARAPLSDAGDDVTTVLVVEDNAEVRAYVRRHLERGTPAYRVVEAVDGTEGLAQARARLPDLIVSDVMMPGLDGFGLCRALRADPETDFIPILLLTAKAEQEDRLEGLREFCDDYLTKPFDPAELRARIENLIALRTPAARALLPRRPGTRPPMLAPSPVGPPSADATLLEGVRATVEAHLGDEAFSVERLAEGVGVSRGHLHRRLRELRGPAPLGRAPPDADGAGSGPARRAGGHGERGGLRRGLQERGALLERLHRALRMPSVGLCRGRRAIRTHRLTHPGNGGVAGQAKGQGTRMPAEAMTRTCAHVARCCAGVAWDVEATRGDAAATSL